MRLYTAYVFVLLYAMPWSSYTVNIVNNAGSSAKWLQIIHHIWGIIDL